MTLKEWYNNYFSYVVDDNNIKVNLYKNDCQQYKYIETVNLTSNDIMSLPIGMYEVINFHYTTINNSSMMFNIIVNVVKKTKDSYKTRMITEYRELKERHDKLENMLQKYEHGLLDFKLTCSPNLLYAQLSVMSAYMHILEERAKIEKIVL